MKPIATFQRVESRVVRSTGVSAGARQAPEETPVAFVYDGGAEAVMLATPADLDDFAVGFSMNEGIIGSADEIVELEIVRQDLGVELRMWLAPARGEALVRGRRRRAGPTGCGLCGVESLAEALRPTPVVAPGFTIPAGRIVEAMSALAPLQMLNRQTRAVHAAAFFTPTEGVVALREDVGRHNALDKLAGALARAGRSGADGVILMTSRVSVELVQKAAAMGAPVLAAVSAPTALAIRTAEAAGICVVGVVRDDGLEVFTHAARLTGLEGDADAA